jgi:hypothetical protein
VILAGCGLGGVASAHAAPSHRLYLGACRQADGTTPAMTYCGCSYDHLAAALSSPDTVKPAVRRLHEARTACQTEPPQAPYPLGLTRLQSLEHPAVPAAAPVRTDGSHQLRPHGQNHG